MKRKESRTLQSKVKGTIAGRLRKIRRHLGYSQKQMASYFGIGQNSYGKTENGYNSPGAKMLHVLAVKFGVSLDWLICGRGTMIYGEKTGNITGDDELHNEINEMTALIEELPLARHLILGYFQKFKVDYKEIINANEPQ
ncbi:MAG: helix-turn-helix transcriptional regulator [bacterium]|nr:helix-turn-helix transcriptional regulator [bacterium]